ncbi:biotin/lipoate--protein ligase family protein [Azospirillum sp. sgz302134]
MDRPDTPTLPPVFTPRPMAEGDPFATATRLAAEGEEAGTLIWQPRRDRLELAVVLGPDRPLSETRGVTAVALAALADALEALGPPNLAIAFDPDDRVRLNGALVGAVRFAAPEIPKGDTPDWAVVGASLNVLGDPDDPDPGRHPDRSCLREEGFGEVEAPDLLDSFARHFLSWMDIWEDAGFAPVRRVVERRRTEGEPP